MTFAPRVVARGKPFGSSELRVGAARDQALRHHDVARERGPVERCFAVGVPRARIGAGREQDVGEDRLRMERRQVQRRLAVLGARVRVRAAREQHLEQPPQPDFDGAVQRRVSLGIARAEVGLAAFDELERGLLLMLVDGTEQGLGGRALRENCTRSSTAITPSALRSQRR